MNANEAECERLVREGDPDRAVSLPFAPADRRGALAALYAFNIETARVREQVSQPMPGEIRLQWWRDFIAASAGDGMAGGPPVAQALRDAIRRYALPPEALERFLDARIFDLYDDPMPDRAAFEAYAGETASALIMLAAMVLDRDDASQVSDAAGHAGVAQAAVGAIRLLPIHRRRGQVYVPGDVLAAAGCSPQELLQGKAPEAARAIEAMAAFASEHMNAYGRLAAALPHSIRAAFLPAELTSSYLRRIERAGPANIDRPVSLDPFRRSFHYWRAVRR